MQRTMVQAPAAERAEVVRTEVPQPVRWMLQSGIIYIVNKLILHPAGYMATVMATDNPEDDLRIRIWDCSASPTVTFDPASFAKGEAKYKSWWSNVGHKNLKKRLAMLGFRVQTKPEMPHVATQR